MTASSLQFLSSCPLSSVQLIGLPQTTNGTTPITPPTFAKTRVSRNLFGSPQQGEIQQLLENELQQKWQRFRQRYSFDLIANNNSESECEPPSINDSKTVASENLVIKEFAQHELRLSTSLSNASASVNAEEINSSNMLPNAANIKKAITFNAEIGGQFSGGDRKKPYARQIFLTDCYNLRKMTQCHKKINNIATADHSLSKPSTIKKRNSNAIIALSLPITDELCSQSKSSIEEPIAVVSSSDQPADGIEESSTENTTISFTTSNNSSTPNSIISMEMSRRVAKVDATAAFNVREQNV